MPASCAIASVEVPCRPPIAKWRSATARISSRRSSADLRTRGSVGHAPKVSDCLQVRQGRSSRHTSTETSSTGSGIGGSGLAALTVTLSAPNCDASRSAITAHSRSSVL